MIKLEFKSDYPEYKELITNFIGKINPAFHANAESKVDAIMAILIGSRNIRLGPAPSVESQVEMRKVIRQSINHELMIPILIPSGPKKTQAEEGVDVAELSMLNILNCINEGVKKHHPLGIHFVIRLEDLTGKFLEPEHTDSMEIYIDGFKELVGALGYGNFIEAWVESDHNNAYAFPIESQTYTDLIHNYVNDSWGQPANISALLPSFKVLKENGWNGLIPQSQREMYVSKYMKLYPKLSESQSIYLMCKYFGASLARKNLNMMGIPEESPHLDIAFMPPVPGYNYPTRFYYRSIELKNSKKSLSFWRAKGFLKIHENGNIRISSATWLEAKNMDFYKGSILIIHNGYEVKVTCDYLLMD